MNNQGMCLLDMKFGTDKGYTRNSKSLLNPVDLFFFFFKLNLNYDFEKAVWILLHYINLNTCITIFCHYKKIAEI